MASYVNLLWCQVCTFYCPLRKTRYNILPEGTYVHIQEHTHQKDLNHLSDIIWKHKQGIKLCYGVYNEIYKDFPICFWFQRMSLSNLFLRLLNLRNFLVLYLSCSCMIFNFTTKWPRVTFYPMPMNKKLDCKDHEIYLKMLRKICKMEI